MIEAAIVLLRLAQYLGAAVLTGSPLLVVLARLQAPPPILRPTVIFAAGLLAVATALGLLVQTLQLAGGLAEIVQPGVPAAVLSMNLGKASLVRLVLALAAMIALASPALGRGRWLAAGLCGVFASASFAWMGHGAASDGVIGLLRLAADMLHAVAAGGWLGALAGFWLMAASVTVDAQADALHRALKGFSLIGVGLVATLIATGGLNAAVLLGPAPLTGLATTGYGRLLALKLACFLAMLLLALANQRRLTPALDRAAPPRYAALAALRLSIACEAGLGLAILALVAAFGRMEPPGLL